MPKGNFDLELTPIQLEVYRFCTNPENMRLPTLKTVRKHMGWKSDNSVLKVFDSLSRKRKVFQMLRDNTAHIKF